MFGYIRLGLYRGYLEIMEKKMETTIVYWGYISGNRELYKDHGKNGNYYLGFWSPV